MKAVVKENQSVVWSITCGTGELDA